MKLVFAGTPEFAAVALRAIVEAGHQVALVLTQPDRPAGRGLKASPGAVKRAAQCLGLAVAQPPTLRDPQTQAMIAACGARAMVVAAYGLIVPPAVLDAFALGAWNIHASLLPRWRGAAPIQRALLAGDSETGVCIMRMEAGLDTGPVLACEVVPIGADDDAGRLHDRLAALGARMMVDALSVIEAGSAVLRPQATEGASYAHKLGREDARIDWTRPAGELERVVRAFSPSPGAATMLDGLAVKLLAARVVGGTGTPGLVLDAGAQGIVVACGEAALRITRLQRAGGRALGAAEFLRGHPLPAGARFGLA